MSLETRVVIILCFGLIEGKIQVRTQNVRTCGETHERTNTRWINERLLHIRIKISMSYLSSCVKN